MRSIKTECLDRMILFGAGSLRRAPGEHSAHYNTERTHQGIGNQLIRPRPTSTSADMPVQRRQRLGELLNFYGRRAA